MFNGTCDSADRVLDGLYLGQAVYYADDKLMMKWSDAWPANVDCDGDNKLDRGLIAGTVEDISRGWLTNHVEGDYYDSEGNLQHYTSFDKIMWTGPGSPLWGQYTVIETILNDPAGGITGLYVKIGTPGFGLNHHTLTDGQEIIFKGTNPNTGRINLDHSRFTLSASTSRPRPPTQTGGLFIWRVSFRLVSQTKLPPGFDSR
jgi:hypothetical protein